MHPPEDAFALEASSRVSVEACDACVRKRRTQRGLDALGADTLERELRTLAGTATLGHPIPVVAIVADHVRPRAQVVREGHLAARTTEDVPAGFALDARRKTSTIEEQNGLFPPLQDPFE